MIKIKEKIQWLTFGTGLCIVITTVVLSTLIYWVIEISVLLSQDTYVIFQSPERFIFKELLTLNFGLQNKTF